MNAKSSRPWLMALVAVSLAALACGGSNVEPSATPFPRPTQQAVPTEEVEPTDAPQATQASTTDFALSSEPYTHGTGAFSIYLPEGWEVEERDNSLFVNAPDSVASIEVAFTHVGVAFDAATLDAYIQAVEGNWFGGFANYEQTGKEQQADGSIGVMHALELSDGTPQTVLSYYWQAGTVVYEEDFWADADVFEAYEEFFVEIANSIQTDPDAVAETSPYALVYTFTDPNRLFEFSVPYGWTHTSYTEEHSVAERFTSPDASAFIENLTYDDGQPMSGAVADEFARRLLQEYYQISDIEFTGTETQSDGSVRLDWLSQGSGSEGSSFYETRNETTFLLLTWAVDSDYHDLLVPVWSTLLDSYAIPES
jgi:hypothetical protein